MGFEKAYGFRYGCWGRLYGLTQDVMGFSQDRTMAPLRCVGSGDRSSRKPQYHAQYIAKKKHTHTCSFLYVSFYNIFFCEMLRQRHRQIKLRVVQEFPTIAKHAKRTPLKMGMLIVHRSPGTRILHGQVTNGRNEGSVAVKSNSKVTDMLVGFTGFIGFKT